ncbi:DUF1573 domain-containing protein [Sphingobacteriaceae bacterium WQ 2009]|uniref:DUF1573 domain-containing protein n=1 Tax=Rhinopithecimicrobium faecis TaxID=2820698 RepID=A0A8T4HBP2_9SPHI|nr:DUF1573 domain-containing protein [Sphingobacteriaceae bacterium WQ 2009]
MKLTHIVLHSVCGLFLFAACTSKSEKRNAAAQDTTEISTADTLASQATAFATIEFEEPIFNFNQVKEGEIVAHDYTFTNVGAVPLILSKVNASCGCTTPDFSKNPILPGQKGVVKVSFNSDGQVGMQQKIITVASNASNAITTVQLKGEVLKK